MENERNRILTIYWNLSILVSLLLFDQLFYNFVYFLTFHIGGIKGKGVDENQNCGNEIDFDVFRRAQFIFEEEEERNIKWTFVGNNNQFWQ